MQKLTQNGAVDPKSVTAPDGPWAAWPHGTELTHPE